MVFWWWGKSVGTARIRIHAQSITYQLPLIAAHCEGGGPAFAFMPLNTTELLFSLRSHTLVVSLHSSDLELRSRSLKPSLSIHISHYSMTPHIFLTPYCDGGNGLLATNPLGGGDSICITSTTTSTTTTTSSPSLPFTIRMLSESSKHSSLGGVSLLQRSGHGVSHDEWREMNSCLLHSYLKQWITNVNTSSKTGHHTIHSCLFGLQSILSKRKKMSKKRDV